MRKERIELGASKDKRLSLEAMLGLLTTLAVSAAAPGRAEGEFPGYYTHRDLSFAAPGVCRFGLYGWQNPAVLGTLDEGDLLFVFSDDPENRDRLTQWGLFMAQPHYGFGLVRQDVGGETVTDYRYGMAVGDRTLSIGAGYGWSSGTELRAHQRVVATGMLVRPARFVSLGLVGTFATAGGAREGVAELGLRPLGDERVAFFGDCGVRDYQRISDANWSVGAVVEPLPGVRVAGRYFDDDRVSLGLQFSLGRSSISTQVHRQDDQEHASYGLRVGGWERTVLRNLQHHSDYVRVDLNGTMKYRKRGFFDTSMTLCSVLEALDRAVEDEAVGGLAVNISGLHASPAMVWEIRRSLESVRASGRKVVVFADNLDEWSYHLASVADELVLDPQGMVFLKGFALGRTYLQGTLEVVGVGVEEWRYFTYKSAFEAFSRDRMSDGEREQLQRMADSFYEVLRADVSRGRGVDPATFDQWMDEGVLLRAPDALRQGMVDRLGRWDQVDAVIADIAHGKKRLIPARSVIGTAQIQDDRWGEPPTIAVVYALGICAMDDGIASRNLVKDMRRAEEDPSIKALVLRVDSPGGDALASDVIAEALRRVREKKPAIVSQGQVAASGGYWLSMYGDKILATPVTLTGSIGVIGGWFYNHGLKEKLGMTTDFVQAGRHADIGFGFRLPFVGLGLPDRALSDDERAKVEQLIKAWYADFVGKVAQGRSLSADSVAVLGEGRVWMGGDARERGLVDGLGGLQDAIALAKQKAGIARDEPVHILELPRTRWFEFPSLRSMLGAQRPSEKEQDWGLDYLKFRLRNNGRVMPILGVTEMDVAVSQSPSFE